MARVHNIILQCVIYLFPTVGDAKNTKSVGGSGFFVGVKSKTDDTFFHMYAVTNAHVINSGATVIRVNNRAGSFDCIEKKDSDWIRHPNSDDIAIAYVEDDIHQEKHQVEFFIPDDWFADKETIKKLDIGVGDDVYIAGRFQVVQGKLQNTPTLRFGNIAQMPNEPIINQYGLEQESYLVECHSISGFSGSPTFVHIPNPRPIANLMTLGSRTYTKLLGIDWGHLSIIEPIQEYDFKTTKWKNYDELRVKTNSAMMGVVPVWKLEELLNQPNLIKTREAKDKQIEKEKKTVSQEETMQEDTMALTESGFKEKLRKVSRKISY